VSAAQLRNDCPACGAGAIRNLIQIASVPVLCNVPQPTREDALGVARADIVLGLCERCGHLFNRAFDPTRISYAPGYENALHFSPRFNTYAAELADELMLRHDLIGRPVVEIGCGDGSFLALLAERGANPCVGVDPSTAPGRSARGVEILSGPIDDQRLARARLILSRQVLEHLSEPRDTVARLQRAMDSRDAHLFVEVPNGLATLRDLAIWDLIYEHFSYFTPTSLEALLRAGGVQPETVEERFDGLFLCATGRAGDYASAGTAHDLDDTLALAEDFRARYVAKRDSWRQRLAALEAAGRTAVVWGAGSKGITFLNLFANDAVVAAVDINPRKQGMFVAGSGRRVWQRTP
jgi:SAM-dependent methyltransferase